MDMKKYTLIALFVLMTGCMNAERRYYDAMADYDAVYYPAAQSGQIGWSQYYAGRQQWSESVLDRLHEQQQNASQALIGTGQGLIQQHSYYPPPTVRHCYRTGAHSVCH